MHWANLYVGLPFGDPPGEGEVHCWSLVRRVLRDMVGIDLPSYGEISAAELGRIARRMVLAADADPWRVVTEPRALDVVLMAGHVREAGIRAPVHCGVMVDGDCVLHVEKGTDSVVVPLTHHTVRGRIFGFRRHKALS